MAKKTWKEKLNCGKTPTIKVLSHAFGEMKEGDSMLIPSPTLIKAYMESVPFGHQKSISDMRMQKRAGNSIQGRRDMPLIAKPLISYPGQHQS